MKVLVVLNSIMPNQGGLNSSTLPVISYLSKLNQDIDNKSQKEITILTTDVYDDYIHEYDLAGIKIISVQYFKIANYRISFQAYRWIRKNIHRYQVIHIHGIYHALGDYAIFLAQQKNVPYIVSIHGMLSPQSMQHKSLKKRWYLKFFLHKHLLNSTIIHGLTIDEKINIENFLSPHIHKNIQIIPNSVNTKKYTFINKHYPAKPMNIVYLGRLVNIKNYTWIIKALAKLNEQPEYSYQLKIAGFADKSNLKILHQVIENHNLSGQVDYLGDLNQSQIIKLLQHADIYINISKTEGLSMSTLEAMSSGTASIISDRFNFNDAVQASAVYQIKYQDNEKQSIDNIVEAVKWLSIHPDEMKQIQVNARRLIEKNYELKSISAIWNTLYDSSLKL